MPDTSSFVRIHTKPNIRYQYATNSSFVLYGALSFIVLLTMRQNPPKWVCGHQLVARTKSECTPMIAYDCITLHPYRSPVQCTVVKFSGVQSSRLATTWGCSAPGSELRSSRPRPLPQSATSLYATEQTLAKVASAPRD